MISRKIVAEIRRGARSAGAVAGRLAEITGIEAGPRGVVLEPLAQGLRLRN